LQPEPLLYLGIPEELRSDPRALMMYRYGHNAPSVYADDTGFLPQVAAGGALMTAALWGYRLYTAADTVATATDYGVAAYALWRGDVSLAQDLAVNATMGAGTPVPNGLATARAAKRYGPELAASAARMGEDVVAAVSRTADEAVDLVSRGTETLYRAPRAGGQAERQLAGGFDPADFKAGDQCCYVTRDREVAESFARHGPYDGRILEVEVDGGYFDSALKGLEREYGSIPGTTEIPIPAGQLPDVNANTVSRMLSDP
jgi:hypothetical protein